MSGRVTPSGTPSPSVPQRPINALELHERLEEHDLGAIHEAFERTDGKHMDEKELRDVLASTAKITFLDDDYDMLFRMMNEKSDGMVTWDEFISYLILGFQQNEIGIEYKTLKDPIPSLPTLMRSNHRHTINRITFCPTVKPDRSVTWHDGSLMTCSRDGVINYWSLDMQLERTVQSTCPLLKIQTTWVTDMVVMPDVSVVCTSSTERDLRFYDTSARKFELRVMFYMLQSAVVTMHYSFSKDINEESKLLLGDLKGNVIVIYVQTFGRGPFKSKPGILLNQVRFERVLKGQVPGFRVVEFKGLHTDFIRQIFYYSTLHGIVTCSQCSKAALLITNITETKESQVFKIPAGAWCFAIRDGLHVVATGGPDCLVRVWNPFVPYRPTAVFYGHHAGIVQMVLQDNGKTLYSLSNDKCIKVWDISSQTCLQTYLGLPPELGERSDMTTMYNPESRQWIIGSHMIAILPLNPKQSAEHTDGNTHCGGVSVVLYNKLFKTVVTCGLDSYIILWNPWDGRRLITIKDAHTRLLHGEQIPVEITAATFDPGQQRLLTGAHDGSLKMWNFNTGTCLRNMRIEKNCEITSVIWVKRRIMAIGWNRLVTEFAESGDVVGPGGSYSKNWDKRHLEDISAAAVRVNQTLATCTYNGELILWRLETGQPYKKYNVADPTTRIKIQYKAVKQKEKQEEELPLLIRRASQAASTFQKRQSVYRSSVTSKPTLSGPQKTVRRMSMIQMPDECIPLRRLSVHTMLFLPTRTMDPNIGTLLASLENGTIQVWSHHVAGGFITSFHCIHKAGDYVISMASDENDEFLFTGSTVGYIKIWLLKNYCVPVTEHICMPKYRLMFPFLWGDRFTGRAARVVKNQPKPILLSSYKAHFMPVSGLVYLDKAEILISCSADYSVRMWTLGGRYLQTIGTFQPWKQIEPDKPVGDSFDFTIPPDIKRVASSTTFRVICGGSYPKALTLKQLLRKQEKDLTTIDYDKVYGKRLDEPILGHHFRLPERTTVVRDVEFDTNFPYIPVFHHLITPQPASIKEPTLPAHLDAGVNKKKDRKKKLTV